MDEEARALVGLEDISVMRRPRARGLFRYDVPIPSALQMVFIVLYATLETVTLITSVVPMVQAQARGIAYVETPALEAPYLSGLFTTTYSMNILAYISLVVFFWRSEGRLFRNIIRNWTLDQTLYLISCILAGLSTLPIDHENFDYHFNFLVVMAILELTLTVVVLFAMDNVKISSRVSSWALLPMYMMAIHSVVMFVHDIMLRLTAIDPHLSSTNFGIALGLFCVWFGPMIFRLVTGKYCVTKLRFGNERVFGRERVVISYVTNLSDGDRAEPARRYKVVASARTRNQQQQQRRYGAAGGSSAPQTVGNTAALSSP